MDTGKWAVGGMLAASLSGCASIENAPERTETPSREVVTILLTATPYNAGRIGRAYLIPSGGRTVVRIEASGVPPYVTRPIHLYTYLYEGSCSEHGGKPAFDLNAIVLASSIANPAGIGAFGGAVTVSNAAPIAIDVLRAKPYAIVVKTGPADGDDALFCGDANG